MRNRFDQSVEVLNAQEPQLFERRVREALCVGGVVHIAPECVLIGIPCEGAPRTLRVTFACAQLGSLFSALMSLHGYDRVQFVRAFKGSMMVRERDIREYARHLGLLDKISKY